MSELQSVIDQYAAVDLAALPDVALLERAEELLAVRNRLDAQLLQTLEAIHERGAAAAVGAESTAAWLRGACRVSRRDAFGQLRLASELSDLPATRARLTDGTISAAHARVVTRTVRDLPEAVRSDAEDLLLRAAEALDPLTLGRVAEQLRAALDRDGAQARAQARYKSRWLSVSRTVYGMVAVSGMLDQTAGEALLTAIEALSAPTGEDDERNAGQRRADALSEIVSRALGCQEMPASGGTDTQVVVTIALSDLVERLGTAGLPATGPLGAAEARRLACDASVIPAVLGSAGEVLDVGRASRTFSTAIRRGAAWRDGGCTFPGCDRPLQWCRLHHIVHWASGGLSSLDNAANLCQRHHHVVHHEGWAMRREPDGSLVFTSPLGHEHVWRRPVDLEDFLDPPPGRPVADEVADEVAGVVADETVQT